LAERLAVDFALVMTMATEFDYGATELLNSGSTQIETFEEMRSEFCRLCRHYGVPEPEISPALATDPCDVTDPPYVRINLRQDCERLYQVRHLFGHYLHDLAYYDPDGEDRAPYSDVVADIIARMIEESNPHLPEGHG
jgi:hypothetical protein